MSEQAQTLAELVKGARQRVNEFEQSGQDTDPIDDALDALTAQLQTAQGEHAQYRRFTDHVHIERNAAQAVIAEARAVPGIDRRDQWAAQQMLSVLSRADLSTLAEHDKQVRIKTLKDAAVALWGDGSAEHGTTKAQYNAIYATWLEQRAASIEQTEADRG